MPPAELEALRAPCRREAARIVGIVARYFGLVTEDLTGPRRTGAIAEARMHAMYLLRTEITTWPWQRHRGPMPLVAIGEALNRDHTTVMHGIRVIEDALRDSPDLRAMVGDMRRLIDEDRGKGGDVSAGGPLAGRVRQLGDSRIRLIRN